MGENHIYDGVEIEVVEMVLNGNEYGGRDFWDDQVLLTVIGLAL